MLNYVNNYLKKFAMEILPSVAATIIGAYIVNHYIVTKPGADAPVAAAVSGYGQNLVTNGDFETAPYTTANTVTSWIVTPATGGVSEAAEVRCVDRKLHRHFLIS